MNWNLSETDAPTFIVDSNKILRAEWVFLSEAGVTAGAARHLSPQDQGETVVDALTRDAVANMEIDGEILHPPRMEKSLCSRLGLTLDNGSPATTEMGLAGIMIAVLQQARDPLTLPEIEKWAASLSEKGSAPNISKDKRTELQRLLRWLNKLPDSDSGEASPLACAGLAHLWFECIHPYPSGSGVIGRAIAARTLMRGMPHQGFVPLSTILLRKRNEYYRHLDGACRDRNATEWLQWFSAAAIAAGRENLARVRLAVAKESLLAAIQDKISTRQKNGFLQLFRLRTEEIESGLCAKEYACLTGTSLETARRDLVELTGMDALVRMGKGAQIRYRLNATLPLAEPVAGKDIE